MKSKKTIALFLIFSFLTVLIVISSVLFSVKSVVGYCYNSDDEVVKTQISSTEIHGIKYGSNIFIVNEREVVEAIEAKIPNVKVINVERKFPSSVFINYIVIEEYFQIKNGNRMLYVSNDCEILRNEKENDYDNKHIILYAGIKPESTEVGGSIFSQNSNRYAVVSELMTAISRLGYQKDVVEIIKQIDLRFLDQNLLYLKTNAGVSLEIQNPNVSLTAKIQLAVSKLDSCDYQQKSKGTIIVAHQGNKLSGAYSSTDRYEKKCQELTTE